MKKFEGDEALEEHKKIRLEEKSAFELFPFASYGGVWAVGVPYIALFSRGRGD